MSYHRVWQRACSLFLLASLALSVVQPVSARTLTTRPTGATTVRSEPPGHRWALKAPAPPTKTDPTYPANCVLLDNPKTRGLMSAAFESALLRNCGRVGELGGADIVLRASESPSGSDVPVNNPASDTGANTTQSETTLALNPNTATLCSAWNDSGEFNGNNTFTGYGRSTNGGSSFTDFGPMGVEAFGDPSLVWRQSDGKFYITTLSGTGGLSLYRSDDDCQTFTFVSAPSNTGADDKELIAVDNNLASANYGRLYVAWTDFSDGRITVVSSSNGGTTWSAPVKVSGSGVDTQGAWPTVAPNGDVYVAWVRWNPYPSGPIDIEVARSVNGGTSFTAVTNALTGGVNPRDNAATISCGRPALNGDIRYLPSPQIAVGPDGALHVVYAKDPDGFNTGDVISAYYRKSTDHGVTWSAETLLGDDGTQTDQYFPTLSVGPTNVVIAAWYDRRLDTANNFLFDRYARISYNGGGVWAPSFRVSDVSSGVPSLNPNFDPVIATCYAGDYDYTIQDTAFTYLQWSDFRNTQNGHPDPDVWFEKIPVSTEIGTLQGVVTNSVSGLPIAGASIQARLSPTQTFGVTTNGSGAYTLIAISGTYTVTASAYAYSPSTVSGVSVNTNLTTTQNFSLAPLPPAVVTGTVVDASGHPGLRLYAEINITTPGYSNRIFTNPATGVYSVSLLLNQPYSFTVTAVGGGYNMSVASVTPTTNPFTKNFALTVDAAVCTAPGYTFTGGIAEDFEGTFPPPGWSVLDNEGNAVIWSNSSFWGEDNYTGGTGEAATVSSDRAGIADYDTELRSPTITVASLSNTLLTYLANYQQFDGEFFNLDIKVDSGGWTNVLSWQEAHGAFRDVPGETVNVDLASKLSGATAFRLRWHYYNPNLDDWDWYAEIDDLRLGAACSALPGGRIVGNVYDTNTNAALNGASVTTVSGTVASQATPLDFNVDDGFYIQFSPAGARTITGTLRGGYGADVNPVTVTANGTVASNLFLPAGRLTAAPASVHVTLNMGQNTTRPFTITNNGSLAAGYEIKELDGGSAPTGPFEVPPFYLPYKNRSRASTSGLNLPDLPVAAPFAAGDVIQSWDPGVSGPWGIAYDGDDDTVWVSSPAPAWGGNSTLYEFAPDGTPTGTSHGYDWSPANGPGDVAYNLNTRTLWVMDIASDDCIHEIDPALGPTGNTICPGFSVSQRGLAYDPTTDTYFAGSWNDFMIHHFDSSGVLLDEVDVGLSIAGLAYNPDTEHLFVMVNDSPNPVYVLDAANNYALLGQFNVSQDFSDYAGAGLEIDCDGNLWAVDQAMDIVYEFESGESASFCASDVPWISETPVSGTLPILTAQPITLTFDAGAPEVNQPGNYYAELKVAEDTPYNVAKVPVTMTVIAPPTWGRLTGVIAGLLHCDAVPATPLKKATLFIQSGTGYSATTTTDSSGTYIWWLDEANSPVTLTLSAAGYIAQMVSSVNVSAGLTTTQNADLRLDAPCVNATASAFNQTLVLGLSTTVTMTLSNTGAASTPFEMRELNGDFNPSLINLPRSDGNFPHGAAEPSFRPAPRVKSAPVAGRVSPLHGLGGAGAPAYALDLVTNELGSFTTDAPGTWAIAGSFAGAYFGGDFLNGDFSQLYLVDFNTNAFDRMNTADGSVTNIGTALPNAGETWSGLTGAADGTLYGVATTCGASTLYVIDPDTAAVTEVGPIDNGDCVIDIAITPAGELYGVEIINDVLLSIDPSTGAGTVIGSIGFDANFAQGMDYEEESEVLYLAAFNNDTFTGELRAADVKTGNSMLIDAFPNGDEVDALAFATGGVSDIPWLSENPVTGTLLAPATQSISVTFDAKAVGQPGLYNGTVVVKTSDPVSGTQRFPVTMTVTAPPTAGKLTGVVSGFGQCDVAPLTPLNDATVFIQSGTGYTATTATNSSGTYIWWLEAANSPVTLTVSAAGYLTQTLTGISILGSVTTTQSVSLRLLQPCIAAPAQVVSTQLTNTVMTKTLTINNTGAATLNWTAVESPVTLPVLPVVSLKPTLPQLNLRGNAFSRSMASAPTPSGDRPAAPTAPISITQSTSQSIVWGNSVACNDGFVHTDNSYLRVFDLDAYGITGDFDITNVEFGVEDAISGSGTQPVTVNLYTLSGPFVFANLTLIGSTNVDLNDQSLTIVNVPVTGTAPSGSTLVVEIFTPDGGANGNLLFVGSNDLGQSGFTYLAAADCGVSEPTPTGDIGFPDMHLVMNVYGDSGPGCGDDVPWLAITPTSGSTPPGGSSSLNVTFNSTGLALGTYTGSVCINSNDPGRPRVTVPVSLTVSNVIVYNLFLPVIRR